MTSLFTHFSHGRRNLQAHFPAASIVFFLCCFSCFCRQHLTSFQVNPWNEPTCVLYIYCRYAWILPTQEGKWLATGQKGGKDQLQRTAQWKVIVASSFSRCSQTILIQTILTQFRFKLSQGQDRSSWQVQCGYALNLRTAMQIRDNPSHAYLEVCTYFQMKLHVREWD